MGQGIAKDDEGDGGIADLGLIPAQGLELLLLCRVHDGDEARVLQVEGRGSLERVFDKVLGNVCITRPDLCFTAVR